jgi:TAT (twin-arginine translocation) pathway signal sequence
MLTRRNFLLASAAVAVAPAIPAVISTAIAADAATTLTLSPMWIVGSPGNYDWHPIRAETMEEAFQTYLRRNPWWSDQKTKPEDHVQRVEQWDALEPDEISSGDWIKAGFGACCANCGTEIFSGGGYVICEEAICEDCVTPAQRAELGDDEVERLVEDLGNDICNLGEVELRKQLQMKGLWDELPQPIWARAVAFAKEEE